MEEEIVGVCRCVGVSELLKTVLNNFNPKLKKCKLRQSERLKYPQ